MVFFVWQKTDLGKLSKTNKNEKSINTITMVTDVGGLGDQGFNDAGWRGIQMASKAFNFKPDVIESQLGDSLYENVIKATEASDVIFGMGFMIKDAIAKAALIYPEAHFVLIDADAGVDTNVASYIFYSGQSGYLAGIIAASVSNNNKIGVVEGMAIPPVGAWMTGFKAGVKTWNQAENDHVVVMTEIAGEFTNSEKGEALTNFLMDKDCDIVVNVAGGTGIGVYKAIKEANAKLGISSEEIKSGAKNPKYFSVGTDMDYSEVYPDILVAALKQIPNVIISSVKDIQEGKFKGGIHYVGYPEKATDISDMKYTKKYVPKKALELVEKARKLMDNRNEKLSFPIDVIDSDTFMNTFEVPKELLD